jgi:hypothetical protein
MKALWASALLAVAILAAPSSAGAAEERVVVDAAISVWPNAPVGEGHCLWLESGILTVALQAVSPAALGIPAPPLIPEGYDPDVIEPVTFSLLQYRVAGLLHTPVLSAPITWTSPIAGGAFCYRLENQVPVRPDASMAERSSLAQWVKLRMMLTPG